MVMKIYYNNNNIKLLINIISLYYEILFFYYKIIIKFVMQIISKYKFEKNPEDFIYNKIILK